jgi:ABC-type transport system involved in multi-copper enzyme maturation permease subunit
MGDPEKVVANRRVADAARLAWPREITTLAPVIPSGPTISRGEPAVLYSQATSTILDPDRRTRSSLVLAGPLERLSQERFQDLLPLNQSILVVWPYLALLAVLTLVCFGLSYVVFLRQAIRSV